MMRILNGTLAMLGVGELITLALFLTMPLPAVPDGWKPPAGPVGQPPQTAGSLVAAMGTRALFRFEDRLGSASPQRPAASSQASAMAQRLHVIGLVTTVPAQAVLEDTQTHQTMVVAVGQSVMDGVTVDAIHDHQVMLNVHGELVELPW